MVKKISILLTCHNRQEKTKKCLQSLKKVCEEYNKKTKDEISFEIFLTDDGCTDGTVVAAREVFPDNSVLHIVQGDGNLYWAGGMRLCWREALHQQQKWDFFLLLNDDVELMMNLFFELFEAEEYAKKHFGEVGIVSGITCSAQKPNNMTYGGDVWISRFLATRRRLTPNGRPQPCHVTNANIFLVPSTIVDKIGIFYEKYHHGQADYDYSDRARKEGFPVVLTANFCGYCEDDHQNDKLRAEKIISMSLKERKAYFNNPIHSSIDYLRFISRISPLRVPLVWMGRVLNLYFPKFYYKINGVREGGR